MIIIDLLISIILFIVGINIEYSILSRALIFASGAWSMFIVMVYRRK